MSSEVVGKKLSELRVYDLKTELEKRGLETTGIKIALLERLQKALVDEGVNIDEYVFDGSKVAPKPQRPAKANGDGIQSSKEDDDEESGVDNGGTTETKKVEIAVASNGDPIFRADESETDQTAGSDKLLDNSNVDNEDSLNLTIGEDDAKIFQDEETDEKPKEDSSNSNDVKEKKDAKSGDSTSTSSTTSKTAVTSATGGANDNKTGDNKETNAGQSNQENDGDEAADDDSKIDGKKEATANAKKNDDSDSKTSTSKSSKDDKESTTKTGSGGETGSNKSSAGAKPGNGTSSASRNLWVSGLSTLTRATDLKIIFSKYGKVIGAKVVTNTRTPGTRCYGYVTMNSSSDAAKCISHLHRTELHGRIISVERAKSDMGGAMTKAKIDDAKKSDDTKSGERKRSGASNKEAGEIVDSDKSTKKDGNNAAAGEEAADGDTATVVAAAATAVTGTTADESKPKGEPKRETAKQRNENQNRRRERERQAERDARRVERDREVLSFQRIREERERNRLRERERKLREEERRRVEYRQRQREEEERLERERLRLKKERLRLEREKADLLKLERERQKLEREKIELERLELKRQQLKIEEAKRAIKRSAPAATDTDRYGEIDRKRTANERRFEPPPPPRFDTAIRTSAYDRPAEKKRIDDYPAAASSKRGKPRISNGGDDYKSSRSSGGLSSEISSFKRQAINDYPKRDHEPSTRSGAYEPRGISSITSSTKEHRFESSDTRGNSFARNRSNERDARPTLSSNKSRYLESGNSGGNGNDRYSERNSSSTNSWGNPNSGPSSSLGKSFGNIQSVATNDPWGSIKQQQQQAPDSNNWGRSMEHQSQDRYDRTYNERKSSSQYLDGSGMGNGGGRPNNTFLSGQRPQDRFSSSNLSSRFDSGRY